MGLSQSTKNKFKAKLSKFAVNSKKCFLNIKNKCYINCCLPIFYRNQRADSEEIVNSNIELITRNFWHTVHSSFPRFLMYK